MLSVDVRKLEDENKRLKEAIKQMEVKFEEEQLKPKSCEFCKFYIQHYVKVEGKYLMTHCGHCTHGKVKDRKPKDSCEYFELGTYDIKRFV